MPGIVVGYEALVEFGRDLLRAACVPEESADLVAISLGSACLRGVDSHGFQLLPYYLAKIRGGDMDVNALGRVDVECGSCLTYDGENGLGQVVARNCCDHAIRLAREHGTAAVTARESNHFGAAAFWAQRMAEAGMIGIVMCNASPLVAPWQGKDPRYGTNPICMALPGPDRWLLDMATTTVAMGKIFKASISGDPSIPAGWAMDKNGVPTTDTKLAVEGLPMPLGGYKGYGLAMMVEILCAVLSAGTLCTEVGGIRLRGRPVHVSQFYMAIDVARFGPIEEFVERMRVLVETMKSSTPASGYDEVLVAGEPEWRSEERRRKSGIPFTDGVWKTMTGAAESLGVQPPVVTMV